MSLVSRVDRSLPTGGLTRPGRVFQWRWTNNGAVTSARYRCKPEEWFLLRGSGGNVAPRVFAEFYENAGGGEVVGRRAVEFHSIVCAAGPEWFGWFQAPARVKSIRLRLGDAGTALSALEMRAVAERDPKCHPSANVPRWSAYAPPFPISRVVLPRELESLAPLLEGRKVEWIDRPTSLRALAERVRGAACVLPPEWIDPLKIGLTELEGLAASAWVIVDLETLARLVALAGGADTEIATYAAPNEFMSARNEYADVATRGMALFDCVPYGSVEARGRFHIRVLRATREWKKYADEAGFATLLSSQTPWEKKCNDVLSAARCIDGGELIGTDLPWLCAGMFGRPLAPRIAGHLLRMHLGGAIDPWAQFWCRWHEDHIVVRDIADLAKRYPTLRTARWQSEDPAIATLGITLDSRTLQAPPHDNGGATAKRRHILIDTGRMDARDYHDGVAPELMIICMRQLAREVAEQTAWARANLRQATITWRFETAAGLKYATLFESALPLQTQPVTHALRIRTDAPGGPRRDEPPTADLILPADAGLFGDGALEIQSRLGEFLRSRIAASAR